MIYHLHIYIYIDVYYTGDGVPPGLFLPGQFDKLFKRAHSGGRIGYPTVRQLQPAGCSAGSCYVPHSVNSHR